MTVDNLVVNLVDQYKLEQLQAVKRYTDYFLAYDVDENRRVTLDILRLAEVQPWFATQFANRARAIAQIRHPNIARIFTVGRTATEQPFVAQAAIDGYPLSQRLEQLTARPGSVNTIYALKLVRQLADALLLATRLDLLHYDLRPQNIILKNVSLPTDDALVLSDLFVPFERRNWVADEGEDDLLAYLSPEQRAGKEIDATSHVYTLGVLAYHLLAAAPPSGPTESHEVLVRRLTAGGSALARVRDDLAPETYELVDRALRKDPHQRQDSIETFTLELERALLAEELLVGSPKVTSTTPVKRPWALLTILVLLALGVVAYIISFQLIGAQTAAPPSGIVSQVEPTEPLVEATQRLTEDSLDTAGGSTGGSEQSSDVASAGNGQEPAVAAVPTETTAPSDTPSPTADPTDTPTPTATATELPSATPTQVEPTPLPSVRVVLNSVYLRRGPGVNYPQVGTLMEGDEVVALARFGDGDGAWFEVSNGDGPIGWLSAAVVQLVEGTTTDSVPTAASIPSTPTSTTTPTSTPSPIPTATGTPLPDNGGGGGSGNPPGATQPPSSTQAPVPTDPPTNPTLTPPPFEG